MLALHTLYSPLTSRPFMNNSAYAEYEPCAALKPFIYCFWAAECSDRGPNPDGEKVLVVPDTCVDIIIELNETRQKITGRLCGIFDEPYTAQQKSNGDAIKTFAIRFHFWAVSLFFRMNMKEIYNRSLDLEILEKDWGSDFQRLFYLPAVREKIAWMEACLLKRLDIGLCNTNLYNSVYHILNHSGCQTVKEICGYSCVSQRQMERLFLQNIGISMKRTANLVRYQNVWREAVLGKAFDVQSAVYRYGYADQSHLLREFKRFHGVTLEEAKRIAAISQ